MAALPEAAVSVFLREVVQRLDEELLKWSPVGGVATAGAVVPRWLVHAWSGRWQLVFAQRELAKVSGAQGTG